MPSNVKLLAGASGGEPTDANFKNVTLLLHGDGSNGAQNNTFIDSSTNNFTITRNGNTTQGSFSPYGSNWSNYFDGTGDYLTAPSNAAFGFGTNDYTVEAWVCPTSIPARENLVYCTDTTGGLTFYYNQTQVAIGRRATAVDLTATYTLPIGVWTHLAVSRQGGTTRIYVNGTQVASTTTSYNYPSGQAGVGDYPTIGNLGVIGYLSNVRVVTGTAVYTSAFTPSTTPLTAITNTSLLTCAYNRFRDGSTNNFTITRNGDVKVTNFAPFAPSSAYSTTTNGGSAYLDGNGDNLSVSSTSAFGFGTGDLTIEAWVYLNSLSSEASIADNRNSTTDSNSLALGIGTNGSIGFYLTNSTSVAGSAASAVTTGAWVHVAGTRSGNTWRTFVNGTIVGTGTNSASAGGASQQLLIGRNINTSPAYMNGYISNYRVIKGTAVYTANFTPPTSPVTAITNTSLLLNATNAAIFDNSMKNDLETVGNAQISTSVKKFGTGSMYFDGSGDYLFAPPNQNFSIGTGDFTVELWAYTTSTSTSQNYFAIGTETTGRLQLQVGLVEVFGGAYSASFTPPSANAWSHIAVSRSSGTLRVFINGVQVSSGTYTGDIGNANGAFIGVRSGLVNYFNGYIDDFRITNGLARYTANFTAPTAPFPNK